MFDGVRTGTIKVTMTPESAANVERVISTLKAWRDDLFRFDDDCDCATARLEEVEAR